MLILIGHALAFKQQTGWLADSSHIGSPLFFFLSGVFLSVPQSWPSWLMRKVDGLLKPYLVVLTVLGGSYFIFGNINLLDYFGGVLYATGLTIALLPLWFLPHLFLSLCCAAGLLYAGNRLYVPMAAWWFVVALLLLCAPTVLASTQQLPLSADLLPVSMALVIAGYMLSGRVKRFTVNLPVFCIATGVFVSLLLYGAAGIDMNLRIYRDHFYTPILIASGIIVLLCAANWMQRIRYLGTSLAFFGKYSLLMLLFHFLWLRWIFRCLKDSTVDSDNAQITIAVILCLLLCLCTIKIISASRWLLLLLLPVRARS
jgi:hypothetical protein